MERPGSLGVAVTSREVYGYLATDMYLGNISCIDIDIPVV